MNSVRFWVLTTLAVLTIGIAWVTLMPADGDVNFGAIDCEDNPKCFIGTVVPVPEFEAMLEVTQFATTSDGAPGSFVPLTRTLKVSFRAIDDWSITLVGESPDDARWNVGDYEKMTGRGLTTVENGELVLSESGRPVWPSWFQFRELVFARANDLGLGEYADIREKDGLTQVRLKMDGGAHEAEWLFHPDLPVAVEQRNYRNGELDEQIRVVSLKVNGKPLR